MRPAFDLYSCGCDGGEDFRRKAVHRFEGGLDFGMLSDFSGDGYMNFEMPVDAGYDYGASEFVGDLPLEGYNPTDVGSEFSSIPFGQTDWSGEYPYTPYQAPDSGFWGGLERAGQWMQKNPSASMMGLGLGLGALQAFQASRAASANRKQQEQAMQRRAERQALMDNPPNYSGMNIRPATRDYSQTAVMNPLALRLYGQGPEQRFFGSRGGKPGGLDQMRAIPGGGGGGQDDTVPAMLSPSEYVMDADVVAALGDGNPQEGARKLDRFRERVRAHKRSAPARKIPPKAKPLENYLEAA